MERRATDRCARLALLDFTLYAMIVIAASDLGAIANPMFKMKGPTMNQKSYSPAFSLKHQQKDMRLALAFGDQNAVSMPVAVAANEPEKFIGVERVNENHSRVSYLSLNQYSIKGGQRNGANGDVANDHYTTTWY
ncbi:hypothetical protein TEA_026152 [Camellia sinensis var. sinensis]|uniref:Uncharacterized protein n=1 Tax=Camellia sinensis var. sinensis TaxID=542762 RepID=A0A4S4DJN1_CAMSN|nr:hypothetical protein TEA_026152 [Camellia sinensis var. sinensis]